MVVAVRCPACSALPTAPPSAVMSAALRWRTTVGLGRSLCRGTVIWPQVWPRQPCCSNRRYPGLSESPRS